MRSKTRGYVESQGIAAPAAVIWRGLVDARMHSRWLSTAAVIEPRAGGLYRFDHAYVGRREAHIDVFEPPRRLRLIHFPQPDWPARGEAVLVDDIMVVEQPDETLVRVLGSGIPVDPAWEPLLRRWRGSWAVGLANLKKLLENPARPELVKSR